MATKPKATKRNGAGIGSALRRPAAAVAVAAAGGGAVALLAPGGVGDPDPVEVTGGTSVSVYRSAVEWLDGTPAWVHTAAELAGEGSLVVLGLLLVLAWWTGRGGDGRRVAAAVLTGVGAAAAYAVSEGVKLAVDEERPCRAVGGVDPVAACPAAGDWSFPSNHATIAGALAVGLALAWPRLAAVTLPLGVLAAALRVLVGVHYPHDVLAGLALGAAVAAAVVTALLPPTARLVRAAGRVRGLGPVVAAARR
ncbi:hypothetical protein GCM10027168_67010 [Streptomyces capparidis]